jgi:hypothetical protein
MRNEVVMNQPILLHKSNKKVRSKKKKIGARVEFCHHLILHAELSPFSFGRLNIKKKGIPNIYLSFFEKTTQITL